MTTALGVRMKTCTRCGMHKPLGEYHRNKRRPDGRESQCRICRAAVYVANVGAYRARDAARVASGAHSASVRHHRARRRASGLCWTSGCPSAAVAGRGGYCTPCAEAGTARKARRRSRARAAIVAEHLEQTDIGGCYLCGEPLDDADGWHVEHVAPLARGGREDYVRVAHAECNLMKSDRFPGEHLKRLHDLGDPRGVDVVALLETGVFRVVEVRTDG